MPPEALPAGRARRLRKINGAVPFPRALDLTPFCDPKVRAPCTAYRGLILWKRTAACLPSLLLWRGHCSVASKRDQCAGTEAAG